MTDVSSTPYISGEKKQEELKEKLESIRIKEEEKKIEIQALQMGLPYINLAKFPVSPEALQLIPQQDSQRLSLICFYLSESSAKLASIELQSPEVKKFIKEEIIDKHNLKAELYLISDHSFAVAHQLYATLPKIKKITKGVEITAEELKFFEEKIKTFQDLNKEVQRTTVSDLLTLILASATKSRASDIHIEAEEKDVKIRFRIDGVLIDVAELDKSFWPKVITRIKLISSLKIASSGLKHAFLKEQTFRLQVIIGCLVVFLMFYFPLSSIKRAFVGLFVILVLSLELINSQIERILDLLVPYEHPKVKIIKDLSAAAVLLSIMGAAIIGIIIFLPYLKF